jgi:hypothetical protein
VLGCSRAASIAPVSEPPAAPKVASGTYKLIVSSSHELSCSQSFERSSDHRSYELTLGDSAALAIVVRTSSIFGPAGAKFGGGPVTTREKSERKFRYVGRTTKDNTFEGVEEKSGAKLSITCQPTTVTLEDKSQLDVVACTGMPQLSEDATSYFKGPVPLAPATGVLLSVDDYGFGGAHTALRKGF